MMNLLFWRRAVTPQARRTHYHGRSLMASLHWFRDPGRAAHLRRAAYLVGAIVFIALYVKSVRGTLDRNDGYDYYVAARALWQHEDPRVAMEREVGYITYPPSNAIVFAPLALLGHTGYALVWNGINAVLVVAIPALALGTITGRVRGHPAWWYLLPALVGFRVLETNATLSQCNLVVGGCCMGAIYLLRRDRPWSAGLVVAVGAAMKVTPGLFGVYFLWRRRWAAAAAALLGAVVFFLVLPALVYGPRAVPEHYRTWRKYAANLVNPQDKLYNYEHGESVRSALLRLLTKSNARKPGKGPFYVNVLDLDRDAVARAAPVISALVFVALFLVSRNPTTPRDAPGPYLEMGLVLVATLLISPYVRKAHYAIAYPAISLAVAALLAGVVPGAAARRLRSSLVAFALMVNLTAPAIVTKTGSEFFNGICIFLWAMLVFAAGLIIAVLACRARALDAPVPTPEPNRTATV